MSSEFNIPTITEEYRKKKIIDAIGLDPGLCKEALVRSVSSQISKKTVYRILDDLIDEKIVTVNKKKPNSREHKLSVEKDNLLVLVPAELDRFEKSFFDLADSVAQINEKMKINRELSNWMKLVPLITLNILLPSLFNAVVRAYMLRSLYIWPITIKDKQIIERLISSAFLRIAYLTSRYSENTTNSKMKILEGKKFLSHSEYDLDSIESLLGAWHVCTGFHIRKEFEQILDSLWEINKDVQVYIYREPQLYGWDFKYGEDNWRKLFRIQNQNPTQTFKNYQIAASAEALHSNKKFQELIRHYL